MPPLPLPAQPLAPPPRLQGELGLLDELELRIARRAEELVRLCPALTAMNLRCWLQAEGEILREVPAIHAQP